MSHAHDSTERSRLLRRAYAVARVHHPNLARMLPLPGGAGLAPLADGAARLAEFSDPDTALCRLEPKRMIWALLDVLSGLRALHEASIEGGQFVHGAVTAHYILLGEPGSARLIPITSAHLMPRLPTKRSGYAAPELLRGEPADQRADVFSVGVLLWEALAQRRLFPDGSREAVLSQLDGGRVPHLGELVKGGWPFSLCHVAERAIAATPAARFGSALELSGAIVLAAGCQLTSSPEPARRPSVPSLVSAPSASAAARAQPTRWRHVTPPATVIDLPPAPGLRELDSVTRLMPPRPSLRGSGVDWSDDIGSRPVRRVAGIPRRVAWAAVAAAILSAGGLWFAVGKSQTAQPPMAVTLAAAEPSPATHFQAAPPSPVVAPSSSASAPEPAASSVAAPASATPKPGVSKPRPVPTRVPRADSDYGI